MGGIGLGCAYNSWGLSFTKGSGLAIGFGVAGLCAGFRLGKFEREQSLILVVITGISLQMPQFRICHLYFAQLKASCSGSRVRVQGCRVM